MANPNIVNVTDIRGKTAVQAVTTTATAIVENTAASGKVFKINSLSFSNIDGTNDATITVDLFRSSTAYKIVDSIVIPPNTTFVAIAKDTSIYLEEGDAIRCSAGADLDIEAICSYEEIS